MADSSNAALVRLGINAYRTGVDEAYQSGNLLHDRVMVSDNVEAETERWNVSGMVGTQRRGRTQEIAPQDPGSAGPIAVLEPRESFNYQDINTLKVTNARWMGNEGRIHGHAVARSVMADIVSAVSAWNTAAYTLPGLTAADMTMAATSSVTSAKMAEAIGLLMDNAVFGMGGPTECTFVMPASQFQHMTQEERLASMDYLEQGQKTGNVTATGRYTTIYGAKVIFVDQKMRDAVATVDDAQGKLPDNRWYCFVKSAIGLSEGTTKNLAIHDWVAHRQSYLLGARANCGAVRIQNAGVVIGQLT